jgi:peptidoglycan/LPS O-acetylase OafA/YrhL
MHLGWRQVAILSRWFDQADVSVAAFLQTHPFINTPYWGFVPKGYTNMTNQPQEKAQTFDSLTGLRFVLAIWIALFHFGDMYDHLGLGSWPIMRAGAARVDVFFVLSGFVLTHIYWARTDAKFDFSGFLQARFARLVPLHLFALSILAALVVGAKLVGKAGEVDQFTIEGLLANIFLLQSWGIAGSNVWNFPAWTISAEFAGYLLFPLFLMLATCFRRAPMLFLTCSLGVLITIDFAFQTILGRGLSQSTTDLGSVRGSAVMLVGVAGRVIFEKMSVSRSVALACATCGAIVALVGSFLAISIALVAFGAVLLVMGLAASDALGTKSWLNGPTMVRLGTWSYGVFILHVPVYMVVKSLSDLVGYGLVVNLVTCIIMLSLVVFVAAFAHHIIEEPARKWIRGQRRFSVTQAH